MCNMSNHAHEKECLNEFKTMYPAIMDILVKWFLNYDKQNDTTEFICWDNELKAIEEIEKWRV